VRFPKWSPNEGPPGEVNKPVSTGMGAQGRSQGGIQWGVTQGVFPGRVKAARIREGGSTRGDTLRVVPQGWSSRGSPQGVSTGLDHQRGNTGSPRGGPRQGARKGSLSRASNRGVRKRGNSGVTRGGSPDSGPPTVVPQGGELRGFRQGASHTGFPQRGSIRRHTSGIP
jgi:hypothetical protein